MIVAVLTGAVAGIIHVLSGPDHLTAIAPIVSDTPGRSWRAGALWGMGHAAAVWTVALAALLLKQALPIERVAARSEGVVGLVLIGIGLWTLKKAIRYRVHLHEHTHDGVRHAHIHAHGSHAGGHGYGAHRHSHAPLGIGLLHGLAGSSHLIGVLPALVLPAPRLAIAYVAGYGLGAVAAMAGFAWALGEVIGGWLRKYTGAYRFVLAGFGALAIGVGVAWLARG
ncbi:MAG: nickel transporter [Candidatus Krumholzibacteriia bacterium]